MPDTVHIAGRDYEVLSEWLIAERYDDGTELRVSCTADLSSPAVASFVRVGPRGGLTGVYFGGGVERLEQLWLQLADARKHIERIEKFRREHDWSK
jgi:hypothetical protein